MAVSPHHSSVYSDIKAYQAPFCLMVSQSFVSVSFYMISQFIVQQYVLTALINGLTLEKTLSSFLFIVLAFYLETIAFLKMRNAFNDKRMIIFKGHYVSTALNNFSQVFLFKFIFLIASYAFSYLLNMAYNHGHFILAGMFMVCACVIWARTLLIMPLLIERKYHLFDAVHDSFINTKGESIYLLICIALPGLMGAFIDVPLALLCEIVGYNDTALAVADYFHEAIRACYLLSVSLFIYHRKAISG